MDIEFKLMSMMQYDASTIGNQDFDNGISGLYAQMHMPISICQLRFKTP
jgi:2',3'-cyclic-nucleotide 2'-phosphodiesterase (5'-nucleotidase family)